MRLLKIASRVANKVDKLKTLKALWPDKILSKEVVNHQVEVHTAKGQVIKGNVDSPGVVGGQKLDPKDITAFLVYDTGNKFKDDFKPDEEDE